MHTAFTVVFTETTHTLSYETDSFTALECMLNANCVCFSCRPQHDWYIGLIPGRIPIFMQARWVANRVMRALSHAVRSSMERGKNSR